MVARFVNYEEYIITEISLLGIVPGSESPVFIENYGEYLNIHCGNY